MEARSGGLLRKAEVAEKRARALAEDIIDRGFYGLSSSGEAFAKIDRSDVSVVEWGVREVWGDFWIAVYLRSGAKIRMLFELDEKSEKHRLAKIDFYPPVLCRCECDSS